MDAEVYLNGQFLKAQEATLSIFDRGVLFADSVYEVIPVYQGYPFFVDRHLLRLRSNLEKIRIEEPNLDWRYILAELVQRNGAGDMQIYLQVTRGNQGFRKHDIPQKISPTIFGFTIHTAYTSEHDKRSGLSAKILEDYRWKRCDIKATALLGNVLLNDEALAFGADTAFLSRDGFLTEGCASNVFLVDPQGIIKTPPLTDFCLPGITRQVTIELIRDLQLPFREEDIPITEVFNAQELMITSTTKEIYPVTLVDNHRVGSGSAGPYWEQLHAAYQQRILACHDR